jgi:hypothetical protein
MISIALEYGVGADAAIAGSLKQCLVERGVIEHATTARPQSALPSEAIDRILSLLREESRAAI